MHKSTNCHICKKSIRNCNIKKHINSCKLKNNNIHLNDFEKIGEYYICPYCKNSYNKYGITMHIKRKHTEVEKYNNKTNNKNIKSSWNKGLLSWNHGLTKHTDDRIKKGGETYSKNHPNGTYWLGKNHTEESKLKISLKMSINNKGGKCKWFKVKNPMGVEFNVQGTWELKFTKVLNYIDENWIKIGIGLTEHSFKWVDENKTVHFYTPDFWSPKLNKYFEIKGYLRERDSIKMQKVIEQNPNILIEMVRKNELNKYLKLFNIDENVK